MRKDKRYFLHGRRLSDICGGRIGARRCMRTIPPVRFERPGTSAHVEVSILRGDR